MNRSSSQKESKYAWESLLLPKILLSIIGYYNGVENNIGLAEAPHSVGE